MICMYCPRIFVPPCVRSLVPFYGLLLSKSLMFFIPEDDGADTGKTRLYIIDNRLYMFRVESKCIIYKRSGADDTHIPDQDIDDLGQFVDLCLTKESPMSKQRGSFWMVLLIMPF